MAVRPGETPSPADAARSGVPTPSRSIQDVMHPTLSPQEQRLHAFGSLLGLAAIHVMDRIESAWTARRGRR